MRLLILLFLTCHNQAFATSSELWLRQIILYEKDHVSFRPEYQHRFNAKGESINNVFRFSSFIQKENFYWMYQVGSFHPIPGDSEIRPTLGLGNQNHRFIYEQRFFSNQTYARLRYRSHYFITSQLNLYQEIFYQTNSQSLTELRVGFNWLKPLNQRIQLQLRVFSVFLEKKTPHETAFLGLNYLL